MITKIIGKNFKGLNFETELKKLNLFIGENGAGKSARSDALFLTRIGFIPGHSKKNGDIFNDYSGSGKEQMSVGFATEKYEFERIYIRKRNGSVTEKFTVNGSADQSKEDFALYMKQSPAIFDLEAFLSLSDQKQIDMIFALFPPAGDPGKLTAQIEKKTEELNRKRKSLTDIEGVISRMTRGRAEIKLPAGNLSGVKAEIAALKESLTTARKELAEAERKQIEADAKVKAEADAKAEAERKAKLPEPIQMDAGPLHMALASMPDPLEPARRQAECSLMSRTDRAGITRLPLTAAASIVRILDALTHAGCDMCAAAMVARSELKKHRQEEMRF